MKRLILAAFLFLLTATGTSADVGVAESSSSLKAQAGQEPDIRVKTLRVYLARNASPLVDYADGLVEEADRYQLDWRLIPAITGVESTFGKRIPKNSYNAYGWANGNYAFSSWDESISVVSQTLREKYYDKRARNISQIGKRYAPPSQTWAGKVKGVMKRIDRWPLSFSTGG